MKYNKLVRDKIPEILKQKGLNPLTHTANEIEYWIKLKDKLREEVNEFLINSNEEEIIDILEVIDSICRFKNINKENLEKLKKKKVEERGYFNKRVILEEA
mgnify:FL=1